MVAEARLAPARSSLEAGQVVRVRGRRGVIDDQPKWDPESGMHLVRIHYLDEDEPAEETVLWERERRPQLVSQSGIPKVSSLGPTDPTLFQAYLTAVRWSTCIAYPGTGNIFLAAPLRSSVLIHNYQLYPLYKAMLMPSVRLFIADDVGLGKTIEAGLVLSELTYQRGIRRIVVIAPAALLPQWRDELLEKFHLEFTILDRDRIQEIKQQDPDANPWMFHQRILVSMDFLKRQEVLDEFEVASRKLVPSKSGRFAWDLVIVDEVHHFAPQPTGEDTSRMEMLQRVLRQSEHRIFLSATPHNGYPSSFTGLLSFLDPVRFQKSTTLDESTRSALRTVFVRRLKEDVNVEDPPPKFKIRAPPTPIVSDPTEPESILISSLREYDGAVRRLPGLSPQERSALRFVRSILTKRLLSSPYAFAKTWWSHRSSHRHASSQTRFTEEEAAQLTEHLAAARAATSADDIRADQIELDASQAGGVVLSRFWRSLGDIAGRLDTLLEKMRLPEAILEKGTSGMTGPVPDAKWNALLGHLAIPDGGWAYAAGESPERVIVFTEYRDTLDYLVQRLLQAGVPEDRLLSFFGGSPQDLRERIKGAFNDPNDPVRILVATDAASEGLNLQETCRTVVHHDLPWNPLRIDQRNGRVDRHGQTRQVRCWHHVLRSVEEFEFLSRVATKAEQARSDLGRLAPLIETGIDLALVSGDRPDLMRSASSIDEIASTASPLANVGEESSSRAREYRQAEAALEKGRQSQGLRPPGMSLVLSQALRLDGGQLSESRTGFFDWQAPSTWDQVTGGLRRSDGARKHLVFDPAVLVEIRDGIQTVSKRQDAALLSLGHPVMAHSIRKLRRFVWDDVDESGPVNVSRWTIECASDEANLAVVSFLTVARNQRGEVLEESFSERSFVCSGGRIREGDANPSPNISHAGGRPPSWHQALEQALKTQIPIMNRAAQEPLAQALGGLHHEAVDRYKAWLKQRLDALASAAREGSRRELERLDREIGDWQNRVNQMTLDPMINARNRWELEQRRKEKVELESLRSTEARIKEQQEHIEWEANRFLADVFPARYRVGHVETLVVGIRFARTPQQ